MKILNDNQTIIFALEELKKYLQMMGNNIENCDITLGLYSDFSDSDKENNTKEDYFTIAVKGGSGKICASNPRSVLYGVYTYLKKLGCKWIRPGKDGEFVPKCDAGKIDVELFEKASYNYRGVCMGGATSVENLIEQADWSAKVGYNRIFMELVDHSIFFENWYNHRNNPFKESENITKERIDEYYYRVDSEIHKRGLIFQRAGHGFMCEPFDINVKDWGKTADNNSIPDEIKAMLAEINGVRGLHRNIPMVTNFCMSNQAARKRVVDYTTQYALNHPEADEIHFWLADGWDNHCECEECRKLLPSDYYVILLNELDEAFTNAGVKAKIVALSYVELLWAPIQEKLKNKDRFLMMFCPITRTNAVSYKAEDAYNREVILPEFTRNDINWAMSHAENFGFLKQWQNTQSALSDYFEFGYHFIWRIYSDYTFYNTARIICEDVEYFKNAGLDGMVMCMYSRSYFPTGLGLYAMAESLWDREKPFEEIADEYIKDSFGEGWEFVKKYLQTLSEVSEYQEHRYKTDVPPKYIKKRCEWVRGYIEDTKETRNSYYGANEVEKASWKYLNAHSEFLKRYTKLVEAIDTQNVEDARKALDETSIYLQKNENEIQKVFDVSSFIVRQEGIIKTLE